MKKNTLSLIILICIIIGSVIYFGYTKINMNNNFTFEEIEFTADAKWFTDNTLRNIYDINFKEFNGVNSKEVMSKKATYKMKIDSSVEEGLIGLKIYNDKKVFLDSSNTINEIITIENGDTNPVKIELTGKDAKKGNVKIVLE